MRLILFHGTPRKFTEFIYSPDGFYFAEDPVYAWGFAQTKAAHVENAEPGLLICEVTFERPRRVNLRSRFQWDDFVYRGFPRSKDYDSVFARVGGRIELKVYEPAQIRILTRLDEKSAAEYVRTYSDIHANKIAAHTSARR